MYIQGNICTITNSATFGVYNDDGTVIQSETDKPADKNIRLYTKFQDIAKTDLSICDTFYFPLLTAFCNIHMYTPAIMRAIRVEWDKSIDDRTWVAHLYKFNTRYRPKDNWVYSDPGPSLYGFKAYLEQEWDMVFSFQDSFPHLQIMISANGGTMAEIPFEQWDSFGFHWWPSDLLPDGLSQKLPAPHPYNTTMSRLQTCRRTGITESKNLIEDL